MRYAACVEYDGSAFSGWQTQKHDVRTVQEAVEAALSKVADQVTTIITAGRTDRAVHASHQVIHFDSDAERSSFAWCRGTNRFLDRDVRLLWVCPVNDEFHARFAALSRSYRFIIYNAPIKSALYRHFVTHEHRELDSLNMTMAAECLLGEHDFSSFRAAGCQAHSPVRNLLHFELQQKDHWIWFDVTANAFLQHMVRNLAGSLIEVGAGERKVDWMAEVLEHKDRTKAGATAQPNGLYLVGVEYPSEFELPSQKRKVAYWGE
ncbi:MAG: tRNA pseudouridine38-40 synthase [Cryomorphaceae bacterium]|jgi:tRNA pseudouridine38-40 synthase